MKVILFKDIPKVGKKGEICDVSDGYGRNYILRQGFGEIASEGKMRAVSKEKAEREAQAERERLAAISLAEQLKSKPVVIKAKAGQGGRLFGSITSQDVVSALKEQFGADIDKRVVKIDPPIKSVGDSKAVIKLHSKVKADITVRIVAMEEV